MKCIVCGGTFSPAPRLPGLVQCSACGFIAADLQLETEELQGLYGADYFHGQEYADYVADRRVIEKNFQRRLDVLVGHVADPAMKNLFEIGCAHGFFLRLAQRRFASVSGIDISAPAVRFARNSGLNATAGDFLDLEIERSIDVACLWDTIEHLARPDLYLAKLRSRMSPGGVVAITTGDIGSLVARVRGRHWRQIHPPTHLHYFSRDTLARLLEAQGFEPVTWLYDGNYRSLDMIAYILLVLRRNRPELYAALKRTGLLNRDIYTNLHDILFVVAKTRS